jgi:intracellular multiplication protein IcmP
MAQQQPRADDVEFTLVLLLAFALLFGWGLWSYAKQPLMEVIRGVKWVEVAVFQIIDPSLSKDRQLLETLKNDQQAIRQIKDELSKRKPPQEVTLEGWVNRGLLAPEVLWYVSNRVGRYTRWPIILIFIGSAIFYMYFSFRTKYRTPYDLEGLIEQQVKTFPVITPIVYFNPTKDNARNPGEAVPKNLPLFAEALAPEEWVAYHQIPIVNTVPDREAMRRAFQIQLGPRWTGLEGMTAAQKCLFAAFALKGVQKRKESDNLLGRIALNWHYKTNFTPSPELMAEVSKINNDPKIGGMAMEIANAHAFRTTALLGVLRWARDRGGVLAPATFLWLRGHDRLLWYSLNNLGRRTYHTEAAGAMAHYMVEKAGGKPLPIPRLETAVLTMVQFWGTHTPRVPKLDEGKKKG